MKKIIYVILAMLVFVACEKNFQSYIENAELENVVQDNKVTLKQALLHAENRINGINSTTRSSDRKVKSAEVFVAKPATRSTEDVEVSFYLINYENNEGFAMVSTDSRATPVYAYSDEGNLNPEDFETNPGLKIFLEGSIENYQIEVANYDDRLPIELPDSSLLDLGKVRIVEYDGGLFYEKKEQEIINKEALLTTYWRQRSPYGDACPNGIGGCGPVAAAQIMAFHKHPSERSSFTYNWTAMTMCDALVSGTIGAYSAAALIHHIGIAADAEYKSGGTKTFIKNIDDAFRSFSYSCSNRSSYDVSRVMDNIDARKPIYIRGDDDDDGHAWVIDGYNYTKYRTTYYYTYAPYDRYDTFITSSYIYFHCNFGWGSEVADQVYNDGYYYAYSFDNFKYNNDLEAIYNITPNN